MRSPVRRGRLAALLLLTFAAGCGATGEREPSDEPAGGPGGAPVELPTRSDLIEIARHEAGRSLGDGFLVETLAQGDALARARAATALGRMPFPYYGDEVTQPLCRALSDADPSVREAAAFALGQRTDPSAVSVLLAAWNDPDAAVRRRLVQAGSRFEDPDLRARVVASLADPDVTVACQAALGAAHWEQEGAAAEAVDRALVAPLGYSAAPGARPVDPELRWRLVYALQQRRAELGRGVFIEHRDSPETWTRLFAVRGLARGPAPRPETARALEHALGDPDWRVVCEAAQGLAAHRDAQSVPKLVERLTHSSAHVRRSVLDSLASFPSQREAVMAAVLRGTRDASPSVRAAALVALGSVAAPEAAAAELDQHRRDGEPVVRAAVARAAAKLDAKRALELLLPLTLDGHPLVASAALEALGELGAPAGLERVREALGGSPDPGLRLVALAAYRRHATAADATWIARAVEGVHGDIGGELWLETLELVGSLGGEAAIELGRRALEHPWFPVREAGRALVTRLAPERASDLPPRGELEPVDVPVPGRHLPLWTTNPMAAVETTRGQLVFELFPGETPLHVYNFLELARRGHYDGLTFHRVVADFVVQGGDPRGDGAGGTSWRGEPLPHEFTPRPYVRGSLGMPRSDHPDSGGCQIFVTHRPTPHLDGRYTVFGELRRGFDVLDRIEIGDRILSVKRLQ